MKFFLQRIERSLIYIAGFDINILESHLKGSGRSEKIRLAQLGATLFVPAIISVFYFPYFLSAAINSLPIIIISSFFYAISIFLLDRYFTLSFRRHSNRRSIWAVSWRMIIAICIGFAVTEPLIIAIFAKSINKELTEQIDREKSNKDSPLQQRKHLLETNIEKTNKEISELQNALTSARSRVSQIDSEIQKLSEQGNAEKNQKNEKISTLVKSTEQEIKKLQS